MRRRLNITNIPRWATNVNTVKTPLIEKQNAGLSYSERVPARLLNWFENSKYEWFRRIGLAPLASFRQGFSSGTYPFEKAVWDANHNFWFIGNNQGEILRSAFGDFQNVVDSTLIDMVDAVSDVDGYPVFMDSAGLLRRSTDGGSVWTSYSSGAASAVSIDTAFGYSDRVVVLKGTASSKARIADSVASIWADSVDDIPGGGSAVPVMVRHFKDSIWYAISADTSNIYFSVSETEGNTWDLVNTLAYTGSGDLFLDVSPDTERILIACRDTAAGAVHFLKSDDAGVTFSEISISGFEAQFYNFSYIGGGLWFALGKCINSKIGSSQDQNGFWSADDGLIWQPLNFPLFSSDTARALAVNDRQVLTTSGVSAYISESIS